MFRTINDHLYQLAFTWLFHCNKQPNSLRGLQIYISHYHPRWEPGLQEQHLLGPWLSQVDRKGHVIKRRGGASHNLCPHLAPGLSCPHLILLKSRHQARYQGVGKYAPNTRDMASHMAVGGDGKGEQMIENNTKSYRISQINPAKLGYVVSTTWVQRPFYRTHCGPYGSITAPAP